MPMCKWQVEPTNLDETGETVIVDHCPKDFTELSNEICSNVIRQLSCLCKHAQDLFRELQLQACDVWMRTERLTCKVTGLKEKAGQFNPTVEQVSLDDIIQCKPFKSGANRQLTGMVRPEAIAEVFAKNEPIPEIHKLNQFRSSTEKDCVKLYSDPNFFFESWCGQIKQEVEKRPTRHKNPAKKKAEITRKPQNLNLCKIKDRMKNEIIGGVVKATNQEDGATQHPRERLSQLSHTSKSSAASVPEQISQNQNEYETKIDQRSSVPPPPASWNESDANNSSNVDDFVLPPPPPLDLPPPPVRESTNRGTLYMIEDFNPDLLVLPLPPQPSPLVLQTRLGNVPATSLPLPPPVPLAPLPPPPVQRNTGGVEVPETFASMISNNAFKLKSTTSNSGMDGKSTQRQVSSTRGDSRSDLLTSIRNGFKLRKVDEVRQETKVQNQGVAGLFDVQVIMEMRRRALEDEDDDDDSECYWDE